jgi:hypothetical protein
VNDEEFKTICLLVKKTGDELSQREGLLKKRNR